MPLNVTSRLEDDFAILELEGSLTLGPSLTTLREVAREMLNGRKVAGIILQVGGVTVTDSSGLGELTVVYTLAASRNTPIRLVEVSPNLRKMLIMTRIDELLPAASDVASAKSELKKSGGIAKAHGKGE